MQQSFFDQTPEGFLYFENFITLEEETFLLEHLRTLDWQAVRMHGVTAKRRVFHYGLDYTYNSRSVQPTIPPPPYLFFLIERTAALMQVSVKELQEILITHYPEGAQIGWHKDAPVFEKIFGLSLLNTCRFKMRKVNETGKYTIVEKILPPRSAYLISGSARTDWQHHIPAVKQDRFSITLRTLYKK